MAPTLLPRRAPPPSRAWAVTLGLWAAAGAACGGEPSSRDAGEGMLPVVEVVTLRVEPLRDTVQLLGDLVADESVRVKPEIAGIVERIGFEEGQAVAQGDELFRLRDGEQAARLREARARLALARDEHARTQRLASQNVAAAAQLERARAELEVARAGTELAEVELERTRIRAPFDGMVGARLVSLGERVTPDSELVRIDAIDPLQVVFSVPETALPRVEGGTSVLVSVAPYPGEYFPGRIFFVAPSVDRTTRRLLIKGRVPNAEHRLRPGMFARVDADLGTRDALLVPEDAIAHDQTGAFVWRIDLEDRAERIPVELGSRRAGRVELRGGILQPGDRVVSAGTHKVFAGARVEAITPAATPRSDALPAAGALGGGGA